MHPCVHCCISYDSQGMDSPSVDEISVHQGWNQCPSRMKSVSIKDEISVRQWMKSASINGWSQCPSRMKSVSVSGWSQCPSVDEISVRQWMKSVSVNGWSQCPSVDEISVHQWMKSVSINGWNQCPSMDEISVHQWMKSVSINGWNQCPSMDEINVHQWMKSVSINGWSQCPLMEERTNKMWLIYSVRYYATIERRKSCHCKQYGWTSVAICLVKEVWQRQILCFFFSYVSNVKSKTRKKTVKLIQRADWWLHGRELGVGEIKHKNPVNLTSFLSTIV